MPTEQFTVKFSTSEKNKTEHHSTCVSPWVAAVTNVSPRYIGGNCDDRFNFPLGWAKSDMKAELVRSPAEASQAKSTSIIHKSHLWSVWSSEYPALERPSAQPL